MSKLIIVFQFKDTTIYCKIYACRLMKMDYIKLKNKNKKTVQQHNNNSKSDETHPLSNLIHSNTYSNNNN